jgi:hypothetical protein
MKKTGILKAAPTVSQVMEQTTSLLSDQKRAAQKQMDQD